MEGGRFMSAIANYSLTADWWWGGGQQFGQRGCRMMRLKQIALASVRRTRSAAPSVTANQREGKAFTSH